MARTSETSKLANILHQWIHDADVRAYDDLIRESNRLGFTKMEVVKFAEVRDQMCGGSEDLAKQWIRDNWRTHFVMRPENPFYQTLVRRRKVEAASRKEAEGRNERRSRYVLASELLDIVADCGASKKVLAKLAERLGLDD